MIDALKLALKVLMRTVTSADKAYKIVREETRVTRDVVRRVWNEVARNDHYSTLLKTWGKEKPPPRTWTVPTKRELDKQYQYVFDITIYDLSTKQYIKRQVSNYQDNLVSFQKAWDAFGEDLDYFIDVLGQQITSWQPGFIYERE